MKCDMCGSEGRLFKAMIEEAELNVCHDCSKFGKVVAIVKEEVVEKPKPMEVIPEEPQKEIIEVVVEDFAGRIKKKRGKLGLTQKDFAKKISEKESVVHKIETGTFVPSLALAKKLGRILHIKLIEQHEESHENVAKGKSDAFTIGDFIKIK